MDFQPSSLEIIHTKLHRPVVTHTLVTRKYLLDRLNKHLNRPLSLVCAPAGYGKSTLVSSWLLTAFTPK
jgi:LuxR family maltose regulon positive regulatory protein